MDFIYEKLPEISRDLAGFLWGGFWQSLLFGGVILAVLAVFGSQLKPAQRFAICLLILVQLSLPILPGSKFSLYGLVANFFPTETVTQTQPTPVPQPSPTVHSSQPTFTEMPTFPDNRPENQPENETASEISVTAENTVEEDWRLSVGHVFLVVGIVWLAGFLYSGTLFFLRLVRFYRMKKHWHEAADPELLSLLAECQKLAGYRGHVRLMLVPHEIGAASCGFLRPLILLSAKFANELSGAELKLALLHELTHLKRLDPLVQQWGAVLKVIYWFNPILRFAIARLQRERELACDCAVLHILEFKNRTEYGSLIIRFAERYQPQPQIPGLIGVSQKHDVKRRIEMILKTERPKWSQFILGCALFAALGLTGLTGSLPHAAEPTIVETETTATTPATPTEAATIPEDAVLIEGTTLDENGKPIPNVKIEVVSLRGKETVIPSMSTTHSNENGNFVFNLRERCFLYAVSEDGKYLSDNQMEIIRDDIKDEKQPQIKFVIRKMESKELKTIHAKILDHAGNPVVGAIATLPVAKWFPPSATSDAEGKIQFQWEKEKPLKCIYATKPGTGFAYVVISKEMWNSDDELVLKMAEPKKVTFKVRNEKNEPIRNCDITASISLRELSLRFAGSDSIYRTTTDAEGMASFDWIPGSGAVSLGFSVGGNLCGLERFEKGMPTYDMAVYNFQPTNIPAEVNVVLSRMAKIDGSVKMSDGTPVLENGFIVIATQKTVPEVSVSGETQMDRITYTMPYFGTDQDGKFSFFMRVNTNMNIGVISKNGAMDDILEFNTGDGEAAVKLELVLEKGIRVFGKVANEEGEPLKELMLVLRKKDLPDFKLVYTDAEGRYEFRALPGSYSIGIGDDIRRFEIKDGAESFGFDMIFDNNKVRVALPYEVIVPHTGTPCEEPE